MKAAEPAYQPGRFELRVLGTSSAVAAFGRHLSAQVLTFNQRHFLIDCGEGTQFQLMRYRYRFRRLDAIFISHLHGDHVLGLAGLLCTISQHSRSSPLPVYGPAGLGELVHSILRLTHATLQFPLELCELQPESAHRVIHRVTGLEVVALPLEHRVPCFGYLFRELPRSPTFLVEKARLHQLPVECYHLLKLGTDVRLPDGRSVQAADYLGPAPPSYSYAYCSDTRYHPPLADWVRGVSLLYHEATFVEALNWQAEQTAHSTARQAAALAAAAEADQLLLGHFSARYGDLSQHLAEARAVFEHSHITDEGRLYPIPFDPEASLIFDSPP